MGKRFDLLLLIPLEWAPLKDVFEGAIQYFAGQRHLLLKFKTPVTLNWFSTRAR